MMLADARTLCPALAAIPADTGGDLAFLEKLAIWAQRWGPWSAIDAPDGLLIDITGAAHLFSGEQGLLADARGAFELRRLAARFAIAPTAGAAWALVHYGGDILVLHPEEDAAVRLADLPVAALRLDAATILLLRRLGLKRIGELNRVGRQALSRRFRNRSDPDTNPLIRLDQLLGHLSEPLLPVEAVHIPVVQRRLLEPIRHRDLLERVVADLAGDMEHLLESQALGARRLELGLWKVDGDVVRRHLELSLPSREAAHMTRLFAGKLDDIDAGFGIELVSMRASWSEPLTLVQPEIEDKTQARPGTVLAVCLDRLVVRLGAKAIRQPVLYRSHIPERAQRWVKPSARPNDPQDAFEFHARPVKLLDRPEPILVVHAVPDGPPRQFRWRGKLHEIIRLEGPERLAPEWWRERFTVRLRDYFRIEDREGQRYWIYRAGIAGDGRGGIPEWFLQGLYG